MATDLGKAKGRLAGLSAYLKIILQELDQYVSSEDCESETFGVEKYCFEYS
jgi:hypothetical protein